MVRRVKPIKRKFDDEIAQYVWDYYHKFGQPWSSRSLSDNAIEEIDIHYPSATVMITPFYRTVTKTTSWIGGLIGKRGKIINKLKDDLNSWFWRTDDLEWQVHLLCKWGQADNWKAFKDEATSDDWKDSYPYLLCDIREGEEE